MVLSFRGASSFVGLLYVALSHCGPITSYGCYLVNTKTQKISQLIHPVLHEMEVHDQFSYVIGCQ